MRKIIAAINTTLDNICDHTAGIPDEEIHQHYTDLLNQGDVILFGRITFQLMEYWRTFIDQPSTEESMNDFARAINKIPKIVFSHSLTNVDWESASIAQHNIQETVIELKQQPGNNILIGSRSLILQLMQLNLIDEYQICVHPVVAGSGQPLFENMADRKVLKLIKTKTFSSGAITLFYEPMNRE